MMKLTWSLSAVVLLAACGGGASPASSSPASSAAPGAKPTVSAPASAKPVASAVVKPSPAAKPGSAAASTAAAAAGSKITIPFTAYSGAFTSIWVAADQNVFPKYGIQADVQYIDANATANALLSGEIPFSSTPGIVNTILAGGDAVLVAKLVTFPSFSLYVAKGVQKVEDLRGKVIADTQRGTAPDNALRDLLGKHGLKPTDVQFAYTPNPSTALAALVAGQASAAILSAPVTVQAKDQGYTEITNTVKEQVAGLAASISVKKERVKDDPASVRNFLQALKDATVFMKANPAPTKASIGKYTKDDKPADLDETYNVFEPTWIVGPLAPADVAASLRYSDDPKAATADPKSFYDNSIVESLK
jgi:ABC-type nitrate/sulfonate/bicarbonate transport system substrate-binding protein